MPSASAVIAHRVVEHVAQQQHRALARGQRLERQQEGEGHALEQFVAALGRAARRARQLVGGQRVVFAAGLDRRRQPGAAVVAAAPSPQQIAREIHRDAHEPRSPGLAGTRRRPLQRAHEGVLHELIGVGCVAGHPITHAPDEPLLVSEQRGIVDGVSGHGWTDAGWRSCPHAAARAGLSARCRMSFAARLALARLASASRPSGPTQSPTT